MLLTKNQAQEYNRFKKLAIFLGAQTSVYSSFAPFATEVTDFNTNFQNLENLIPEKTENASGVTTDKTGLKHETATDLSLVCRKTRAYAIRFNQPQLAAQTNTYDSKIFRMKDADILAYATSIVNLLTPLLTNPDYIPYGVTAASLSAITALATSFNKLIGVAKQDDSGNTIANNAIDNAINVLHGNINSFDLLIDEFEAGNPGFVQGYHINSTIDRVGIRHSGIEGIVRNINGEAIPNAKVHLDGTTKAVVTDLMGTYRLARITPDDYMVVVSADGYAPHQELHHISSGKIDELDFHLAV